MNAFSMSRLRQLVAVYLAVTLAIAGAAGLSPLLHQLLEHSGQGAPHLHHGGVLARVDEPSNKAPAVVPGEVLRVRLKSSAVQGHRPFSLPKLSLRLLHQLSHGPVDHSGEPVPPASPDAPGHQHHSLAQTLASGLVEAPGSAGLAPFAAPEILRVTPQVPVRLSARELDRQSAGRAPPAARG
ncbi:MAG: hypothetical protein ABIS67_02825 [Candidatus Eisenbacteria bacterium]